MNIGNRIREARKFRGLTQIELAEMAGISVNSLRLYESESRNPKIDTLEQIANALNIDVRSFQTDNVMDIMDIEVTLGTMEDVEYSKIEAKKQTIQGIKSTIEEMLDDLNIKGLEKAHDILSIVHENKDYQKKKTP